MKARDVMVKDVVTVGPGTTVAELAKLLTEKRISGAPVVDQAGTLVGIVSETDLMHRSETGTERRRKWWVSLFMDKDTLARDFLKAHGTRTADIMSKHVTSVAADAELQHVAELMDKARIKRTPVLENGRLVGIITRGDLVRALAGATATRAPGSEGDAAMQGRIMQKLAEQPWLDPTYVSVAVNGGVVEIHGLITSKAQHDALRVLVEEAGAVRIDDHVKVGTIKLYAA